MNWSDEILMAFADGELEAAQRAEIERALGADAALRERVGALKAQRERLAAAYAPVLDEAVPERLASLLREGPAPAATASIVDLASVRAAADPVQQRSAAAARRGHLPTWAQWGGMAASVLLGVVMGLQWRGLSGDGTDAAIGLRDGRLVAGGAVAEALSSQLASETRPGARVTVQLSFVDRGGSFCRTFSTGAVAGLACRQAGQWTLEQLVTADAAAPSAGGVRQAASELPRALLDAVDQRIAGAALDAAHERAARDRGWQR